MSGKRYSRINNILHCSVRSTITTAHCSHCIQQRNVILDGSAKCYNNDHPSWLTFCMIPWQITQKIPKVKRYLSWHFLPVSNWVIWNVIFVEPISYLKEIVIHCYIHIIIKIKCHFLYNTQYYCNSIIIQLSLWQILMYWTWLSALFCSPFLYFQFNLWLYLVLQIGLIHS